MAAPASASCEHSNEPDLGQAGQNQESNSSAVQRITAPTQPNPSNAKNDQTAPENKSKQQAAQAVAAVPQAQLQQALHSDNRQALQPDNLNQTAIASLGAVLGSFVKAKHLDDNATTASLDALSSSDSESKVAPIDSAEKDNAEPKPNDQAKSVPPAQDGQPSSARFQRDPGNNRYRARDDMFQHRQNA